MAFPSYSRWKSKLMLEQACVVRDEPNSLGKALIAMV
jgi:hypothetical protein